MLVNKLCTSSPVNFIRRLEVSAQKLLRELQEAAGGGAGGDIVSGGGGSDDGGIWMETNQERKQYTARDSDAAESPPVPPNPAQRRTQEGDLQGSGGTAWGIPADGDGIAAGERDEELDWGATGTGSSAGGVSEQEPVGAEIEPLSGVEDGGSGICRDRSDALGEGDFTGGDDGGRAGAARIRERDMLGDGDGGSSSSKSL